MTANDVDEWMDDHYQDKSSLREITESEAEFLAMLEEFGSSARTSEITNLDDWSRGKMRYRGEKLDDETAYIDVHTVQNNGDDPGVRLWTLTDEGQWVLNEYRDKYDVDSLSVGADEPRQITKREWSEQQSRIDAIESSIESLDGWSEIVDDELTTVLLVLAHQMDGSILQDASDLAESVESGDMEFEEALDELESGDDRPSANNLRRMMGDD